MSNQQQRKRFRRKNLKLVKGILLSLLMTLCLSTVYAATPQQPTDDKVMNVSDQILLQKSYTRAAQAAELEQNIQDNKGNLSLLSGDAETLYEKSNKTQELDASTKTCLKTIRNKYTYYLSTLDLDLEDINDASLTEDTETESIKNEEEEVTILSRSNFEEDNQPVVQLVYECDQSGYVGENVNVRTNPDLNSDILDVYLKYTNIQYSVYNNDWVVIKYNDGYAYIYRNLIRNGQMNYSDKSVYGDSRKSYMDWKCITYKPSLQYKIQANYAYTGYNGVRVVNGRYLIALGSYYSHNIGQYVDLMLSDGTVIPCIIGDAKKNIDTDNNNAIGADGGVAEFIVDTPSLSREVKLHGDVSYVDNGAWLSNVQTIRLYDENLFS